jgi:small subunit ribosomal protein S20
MPITKSAKKALRQNIRRKIRNLRAKRKIKDLKKKISVLFSQGKHDQAKNLLPQYYKLLDKAAKTNLIKQNKADREKSRITKLLNKEQKEK